MAGEGAAPFPHPVDPGLEPPAQDDGLARVLDVRLVSPFSGGVFEGAPIASIAARMFGGHAMAQAVLAAGRTVPDGRALMSVHSTMLRPGDAGAATELAVEVVRDGAAYSTRSVEVAQSGRSIARVATQWHASEECSVAFAAASTALPFRPPPQPLPYPAPGVATAAFDLRWVDDGPGRALWFRLRRPAGADLLTHAALAVYISDLWLADTALRRGGRRFDDRSVLASTLEHSIWLHRPLRLDGWCCLLSGAESVQGGRAVVTAELRSERGDPLATVVQAVSIRDRLGSSTERTRSAP